MTKKQKKVIRDQILEDRILEPIQIIFNFHGKDAEKEFKAILNDFQNLGFSPIGTKRASLGNCFIFCYYVKVKQLPFTQDKKYSSHLEKKYVKILKEISVQKYRELDLEWTDDEVYEISQAHIDKFLQKFLKGVDNSVLEIVLTNLILNSNDLILSEEDLKSYGLIEISGPLLKFLGSNERLKVKELRTLFQLIDSNDYILIKQIFNLILEKSSFTPKQIYDEYHKVKGRVPFPVSKLGNFKDREDWREISVLEMFFKDYILRSMIIQDYNDEFTANLEDVKFQIPFDVKAYELQKSYPKFAVKIIKNQFREKRENVLPIFKTVLENELKRSKKKFKGLIVSFAYEKSEETIKKMRESNFYFDDLKKLFDKKLETFRRATKSGEIRKFVIVHGNCLTQKNKIDFDWTKEFNIRDKNHQRTKCKIIHNRTYFNDLPLQMESEIELQGNLIVKYVYNKKAKARKITQKYIEVIDIKIIDNFRAVRISLGNRYSEEYWVENTKEGLSKFTYSTKEGGRLETCQTTILSEPLVLLDVFRNQNEKFYEYRIDNKIITSTKKQLIEELDEENIIVDKGLLEKYIGRILKEMRKEYKLEIKPMYNTMGIFLDDKEEFVLVYEDNEAHRIIGENDLQLSFIDEIKRKELDRQGSLTESYFRISHNPTLPQAVRLSLLGYSAIHPFYYAISKKIEFLPYLFLIGINGSGKTTNLVLFVNKMYGTKIINPDKVKTGARITKNLTTHLFSINIEEMMGIPEDQMSMLKAYATERPTRDRMDNQKMNKEQMYAAVCGSSNSNDFLKDDPAFRIRCIIHHLDKKISHIKNKELVKEFIKHERIIKDSNKIYGFYFLSKALEYIDKTVKGNKTIFQKFIVIYNEIYDKINKITENIEDIDIRRIKLYSLMYLGWCFWNYAFQSKGFKSDLLEDALNLESNVLFNYIKELEYAEKDINLEIFESILEYYRGQFETKWPYKRVSTNPTEDEKVVLTTRFVEKYDQWAKQRGYETLKTLKKLAELQSALVKKDTSVKSRYCQDENGIKFNKKCVIFYYEEILELIGEGPQITNQQGNDTTGKIDLDKILVGKSRSSISKLDRLMSRLNEIFEENGGEALEKKNIVQILDLEDGLDEKWVREALAELVKEGTLYEPKENMIKWPDK